MDRYLKNIGCVGTTFFKLKLSLRKITLLRPNFRRRRVRPYSRYGYFEKYEQKCSEILYILNFEVKLSRISFMHIVRAKFSLGENFFSLTLSYGVLLEKYLKNIGSVGTKFFKFKLSLRNMTFLRLNFRCRQGPITADMATFEIMKKNAQR